MARKVRRSDSAIPSKASFAWGQLAGYIATAVISVALGIGGTLAAIHSRPAPSKPNIQAAAPPTSVSTLSDSPPPGLTNGLPPDKAAVNYGNWYYDHKNWPLAIQFYNQAIKDGIDNPDIRTDLGNAYRFAGDPKQAMTQYQTAQKQNPNHENSLFNQGAVYALSFGDVPKAISIWRTYLMRFPHGEHATDARQLIAEIQAHSAKQ